MNTRIGIWDYDNQKQINIELDLHYYTEPFDKRCVKIEGVKNCVLNRFQCMQKNATDDAAHTILEKKLDIIFNMLINNVSIPEAIEQYKLLKINPYELIEV